MKTRLMIVFLAAIVIMSGSLFAQIEPPTEPVVIVGDTLMVFPTYDGEAFDALNKWIDYGFSLDDAVNDTSVKVFKLARNQTYKISHVIMKTRHLNIVADKPDLENAPPLVVVATDLNNKFPLGGCIKNKASITLRHIYFCGADIEAPVMEQCALADRAVVLKADSCVAVIDGCYFEWFRWSAFFTVGNDNIVKFTNNLVMNCLGTMANRGIGGLMDGHKVPKLLSVVKNNTCINSGARAILGPRESLYGRKDSVNNIIDHNTIINTTRWPLYGAMWTNAIISNNIFYNTFCLGETEEEKQGQDTDGLCYGIVNIDTLTAYVGLDSIYAAREGIDISETESYRKMEVLNNYYGWTDEIIDYWAAAADSVDPGLWMNDRTAAMFADDENYPYLNEEGTYSREEDGDPQFIGEWKSPEQMEEFIGFLDAIRTGASSPLIYPYCPWEPTAQPNAIMTWPIPLDLRVSNPALVGSDGKPLGDLNWYSEYAERWSPELVGPVTGIEERSAAKPTEFALEQNYPNPFNPVTNIRYTLPNAGNVKLCVYNMLGKKVKTLVDVYKTAGVYNVEWDGTNSAGQKMASGVYFYKLEMGSNVQVKKMLFMK